MKVIAHKGGAWSGVKENSLRGFSRCVKNKAIDMIEMDVRLVKDIHGSKHWVVCHDETMGRLLGVEAWLSEYWGDFPALEAVMILLTKSGRRMPVYIDLKGRLEYQEMSELVMLLEKYPQVLSAVACFDTENLQHLLKLKDHGVCPSWIKIGMITENDFSFVRLWKRLEDLDFISFGINVLTHASVKEAQGRGLEVYVYTIDDSLLADRYVKMGVDGIVTDSVLDMINWVKPSVKKNRWSVFDWFSSK